MQPKFALFQVATLTRGRRALRSLAQELPTVRERTSTRQTTHYDTFDWRLYRAGISLSATANAGPRSLRWTSRAGETHPDLLLDGEPGFAWDLPAGAFREALTPILEMRRLLPVVRTDLQVEVVRVLDSRQKTVARLALERGSAQVGGAEEWRALPVLLRILPVKGYGEAFARLRSRLEADPDFERVESDEVALALAGVGRKPGDYSSKLDIRLQPEQRADETMKLVHRTLLRTMLANEEGLRRNVDSEFLHDFRVAVRRTRSALTQVKGVFPRQVVDRFRREFSWLGQLTGPTRDADVYLLTMPGYRASLPESVRDDLEPLERFLRRHQRAEHRRLVRSLGTRRYERLVEEWRRFLDDPVLEGGAGPAAPIPIREVASARIWKAYRRVLKRGRAIGPDGRAEALHRLRIDCKKLRYLLEFFRSLYPPKDTRSLIKTLKQLQDNLGEFNDLEVQQAALARFAHEMAAEKAAPAETLLAMGRLVERFGRRQLEVRRCFKERFKGFAVRENRERFARLFRTRESAGA